MRGVYLLYMKSMGIITKEAIIRTLRTQNTACIYKIGVFKVMYLPKELFRNIDNEKEVLEIIYNLELDLKTDKSLTSTEAISMLEELGEDLIIKELDLMKKDG